MTVHFDHGIFQSDIKLFFHLIVSKLHLLMWADGG